VGPAHDSEERDVNLDDGPVLSGPTDLGDRWDLPDVWTVGVLAATPGKIGTVRVEFQDGRSLRVGPDDRYEACAVRLRTPGGDRRFEFIVPPGGGLAEFDFTSRAGGR
jgi:hypothetical protein